MESSSSKDVNEIIYKALMNFENAIIFNSTCDLSKRCQNISLTKYNHVNTIPIMQRKFLFLSDRYVCLVHFISYGLPYVFTLRYRYVDFFKW